MLFSISSLVILAFAILAILLPHTRVCLPKKEISPKVHRLICAMAFVVGCFARLICLDTLPGGISPEEALVGVQAKALWETGGFLFDGGWTAQLAQWTGESAGPLLAVVTAPFVGLLGMTPLVTRLPQALLSCAAMPAAYGVGNLLGGKRAARWSLVVYALSPYFVLTTRLTAAPNLAVCLLPAAVYLLLRGMKEPAYLYAGTVLTALMSYTQNMYFVIAPTAIVFACLFAALCGIRKHHALLAAAAGVLVCMPALLTLWVNLCGHESFDWLGIVHIPVLDGFDKGHNAAQILTGNTTFDMVRDKFWAVVSGSVFQVLVHNAISAEMFEPTGLGTMYILSLPLMLLGALGLLRGVLQGRSFEKQNVYSAVYMLLMGCATVAWLVVFGSRGYLDQYIGYTCVYDYSAMLLFDVLLMVAGLCQLERRSLKGTAAMGVLFVVSFGMLMGHLFGSSYRDNANTYFAGFGELARKAEKIAEREETKVNVTGAIYPHAAPSDAAEMMYLYAVDADVKQTLENRMGAYDIIYAKGIENPDPAQVYLVTQNDIMMWDLSGFEYEEMGEFVLLTPAKE